MKRENTEYNGIKFNLLVVMSYKLVYSSLCLMRHDECSDLAAVSKDVLPRGGYIGFYD